MNQKDIDRFKSYVAVGDGCHAWVGCLDQSGYGRLLVGGKEYKAHRFAWSLKNGEIPEGMMICHKCDNPGCVNVDHLFLGTQSDNMNDMHAKKRHVMRDKTWIQKRVSYSGANNPNAKFTAEIIMAIRSSTDKATLIAQKYGVHRNIIYDILKHKTWKNT